MKRPRYMSPFRADNEDKVRSLNRDNIDTKHGWILCDGSNVSIGQQRSGEQGRYVSLPRAEFARLARWFFTEQTLREKKRS